MPVHINELEAEVAVEDTGAPAAEVEQYDRQAALERWRELQRREQQLAARTAAFGFDD
jgi:hypothetical protein